MADKDMKKIFDIISYNGTASENHYPPTRMTKINTLRKCKYELLVKMWSYWDSYTAEM